MNHKFRPISSLYDDATDYNPSGQDFGDLKIIRDTIKDIEYKTPA